MGLRIPAAERRNYKDSIRRAHVAPPLRRRRSGACGNKTQMRPIAGDLDEIWLASVAGRGMMRAFVADRANGSSCESNAVAPL